MCDKRAAVDKINSYRRKEALRTASGSGEGSAIYTLHLILTEKKSSSQWVQPKSSCFSAS